MSPGLHIGPYREIVRRDGRLSVDVQLVARDGAVCTLYPENAHG